MSIENGGEILPGENKPEVTEIILTQSFYEKNGSPDEEYVVLGNENDPDSKHVVMTLPDGEPISFPLYDHPNLKVGDKVRFKPEPIPQWPNKYNEE